MVSAVTLTIPLLGTVDLGTHSLWASTALISFVDGFNPCSLWVLLDPDRPVAADRLPRASTDHRLGLHHRHRCCLRPVHRWSVHGPYGRELPELAPDGRLRADTPLCPCQHQGLLLVQEGSVVDDRRRPEARHLQEDARRRPGGDSAWALLGRDCGPRCRVSLVGFACTSGFPVVWTDLVASKSVSTPTFVLLLALYADLPAR